MKRELNEFEKKEYRLQIKRLEEDADEMLSDIEYLDFMIKRRLYVNYKKTLKDFKRKKIGLVNGVEEITYKLQTLYQHLREGVDITDKEKLKKVKNLDTNKIKKIEGGN